MALSGQSLNAVAATGPGTPIFFDEPHALLGLQAIATGLPSQAVVFLEGTIDGVTWNFINQINVGVGGGASSNIADSNSVAVIGIRATLDQLVGGSSPTVTAWVAAA